MGYQAGYHMDQGVHPQEVHTPIRCFTNLSPLLPVAHTDFSEAARTSTVDGSADNSLNTGGNFSSLLNSLAEETEIV